MATRLSLAHPGTGEKPSKVKRPRATASDDVAIYTPRDLTADERYRWRKWAPRAIAKKTLTLQTVPGFRLLIECEIERQRLKDAIDHDGVTSVRMYTGLDGQERIESITPHPLLPAYSKQQKQVEILLARFGLLPFGKAEPDLPAAAPANPWADVGR